MHIEERLQFIDSLAPLPVMTTRSFANVPEQYSAQPHDINKPTASVMPDTIDAFLPGVSEQMIDDVNLCKLVMQNAADKLFPKEEQLFEWYKCYVDGLSKLGWVIQNKNMQEVRITKIGLTMDQVALEIVAGLIGPNPAGILANVAKKAIEEVKKSPKAIEIFDKNKKLGAQAKFDIAPVWMDNIGQANMILNCISLDARESTHGILFWKTTRQSTTIKSGAVRTYLNNKTFSGLRETLYKKYLKDAEKFIIDLPDF